MLGYFSGKINVHRLFLLCALLACSSLSGCATTAGLEATGKKSFTQEGERTLAKTVVFNNSAMSGDIEIVDLKSSRAGDLMKAQVSLRSTNRDTMNIQYAFQWFDAQGMELGGTTIWKPFIVYGKETRTVQGVAPDPRGSEFKLKVRGNDE